VVPDISRTHTPAWKSQNKYMHSHAGMWEREMHQRWKEWTQSLNVEVTDYPTECQAEISLPCERGRVGVGGLPAILTVIQKSIIGYFLQRETS